MARGQVQDRDDELQEFDASYGDPSHVDDEVGGQTPKRRADKRGGEMKPILQGSSKAGRVANVLKKVNEMEIEDIDDLLDALDEMGVDHGERGVVTQSNSDLNTPGQTGRKRSKTGVEKSIKPKIEELEIAAQRLAQELEDMDESNASDELSELRAEKEEALEGILIDIDEMKMKYKKKGMKYESGEPREVRQVTAEDIDISADVNALFEGDDSLTEEFKEKATLIFEAAVVSKINESLQTLATDYDADFEIRTESQLDEMAAKIDDYLDYVVDQWMEVNELALDSGIKSEIAEGLLNSIKQAFDENYIEVPESKVDVVEELANSNEELAQQLGDQIDQNIELSKIVEQYEREQVVEEVSAGLSEAQADKLQSLSEGVEFDDPEQYKADVQTIAENYFGPSADNEDLILVVDDDGDADNAGSVELDESTISPNMARYVGAISQTVKNQ